MIIFAGGAAAVRIILNISRADILTMLINIIECIVLQETLDLNSGGHKIIAKAAGQTLISQGDDAMTGDGATTFKFNAAYGHDMITNFTSTDHVSMPGTEFACLSNMLSSKYAQASNGDVVMTAADGDTLTIDGTTIAVLSKLTNSFSLV